MSGGPEMMMKLMPMATREIAEPMLEKVDLLKWGSELMREAINHGKTDIVELLIDRGVDVLSPPEVIASDDTYRKSSFALQAVAGGSVPTLNVITKNGGSLSDGGFITLSKKRKNLVISNAVGAAAYFGKTKMLEHVINKLGKNALDVEAIEEQDKKALKQLPFQKEMAKYTPLMLTIAKGDQNLDCLKLLL